MSNFLTSITDDPRINVDPKIYNLINEALTYYRGDDVKIDYTPSVENNDTRKGTHLKERKFDSLNMTKRVSSRLASIVFGKQAEYSFENEEIENLITPILLENQFNDYIEQNLERAIALGGFAARPYVQNNKIKIAWCDAEQFYPLKSNTAKIEECAIVSKITQSGNQKGQYNYYTLLEFHQWDNTHQTYTITNELYKSNDISTVGQQVPLGTDDIYTGLQDQTVFKNISYPLFAYFKMPGTNNKVLNSPLGLGIVANNKNTLDDINYTHDALQWEIKTGKRTILVPPESIEFDELHRPKFNTETDAFIALNGVDDFQKPEELNMDIRIQEFNQIMQFYLRELETGCGVSAGTFSSNPETVQTATQVVSENSMTYQTRESILTNLDKFTNDLFLAIIEMASTPILFDNNQPLIKNVDFDNLKLSIHHDDSVFVDADTQQNQDLKAVAGGVMSKKTFLMRNYGMSEQDAENELQQIHSEEMQNVPNNPISAALNDTVNKLQPNE